MSGLAEFLLARIAEDEAVARAVPERDLWSAGRLRYSHDFDATVGVGSDPPFAQVADDETADHIARWDPARVLAECDAKRRIVELHTLVWRERPERTIGEADDPFCGECSGAEWPCETLRLLALPYADHRDYDEAWRP